MTNIPLLCRQVKLSAMTEAAQKDDSYCGGGNGSPLATTPLVTTPASTRRHVATPTSRSRDSSCGSSHSPRVVNGGRRVIIDLDGHVTTNV